MYDKDLSDIFKYDFGQYKLRDKNQYHFGWKHKNLTPTKKILYVSGCSWLTGTLAHRALLNAFSDYLIINRAIGGQGNDTILQLLQNDILLLDSRPHETYYIISFSEVGRNWNDFKTVDPKNYKNSHTFFEGVLKTQYAKTYDLLKNKKNYITTSFVPNPFNSNKSIYEFCCETEKKPDTNIYNYSSNVYTYMRNFPAGSYPFDIETDILQIAKQRQWLESHKYMDDTLHPNQYKPYVDFFNHVKKVWKIH